VTKHHPGVWDLTVFILFISPLETSKRNIGKKKTLTISWDISLSSLVQRKKRKWSDECVKGQIMHAALKEIFSSIIQPGKSGVQLLDADGNERLCYPYFAYYIADWPGSRVTLTKDGKMTNLPCHGCLVTLENLGVLNNTVRSCSVRTHDTVINLYEEAAAGNATQKKALAKKHSFHPHKIFFGNFLAVTFISKWLLIFFINIFWGWSRLIWKHCLLFYMPLKMAKCSLAAWMNASKTFQIGKAHELLKMVFQA